MRNIAVFAAALWCFVPARAQGAPTTKPPAEADAGAALDELFGPAEGTEAPPAEAEPAVPSPTEPASAVAPAAVPQPPVVEQPASPPSHRTVAERGGLFGLGLVLAPKLGGGLGNVFFQGLGATFVGELEVGYALPLELPLGRDLQLFGAFSYTGPSSTQQIDGDARLPDGGFSYTLTLHQVNATWGALYRIPTDAVPWLRPYVAAGARTVWSWTVIDGEAGGEPFGTYVESGFDLGAYGAVGADLYFGPGAVLVELQGATTFADRFVLRQTNTLAVQLAVGYRFFL